MKYQIRVATNAQCYPNYITPLAGVISHYKSLGVTFMSSDSLEQHQYLSKVGLLDPFTDPGSVGEGGYADRIWMFTPETHYDIVSNVMKEVYTGLEVEKGVLHSVELCLNEITDNVLNHSLEDLDSGAPHGFLMAQIHSGTGRVAISVFDDGVGIYRSLKRAIPSIHDSQEAITMAIRKGVTSGNGRGNGLWILERIVMANGGSLEITSDGARFILIADKGGGREASSFSRVSRDVPGTTLVDFQLDTRKPMNLESVLDYSPTNLWLESHEDGLNEDDAVIRLFDESKGFGTRVAARQVRTMASNLSREFGGRIVLDFDGVELISTSYADELVAKLLLDERVGERLLLRNLGDVCRITIGEVLEGLPLPWRVIC